MKEFPRNSLLLSILGIGALAARTATAQSDINFSAPNVLLLVDTSGSMEYLATSATQTSQVAPPVCNPTATTRTDGQDKSRWINVIEVLGGTIPNYHCQQINRTSSAAGTDFSEYKLNGTLNPPDYGYPLPYHRPMSGTCVRSRGTYDTSNPAAALDISTFPLASTGTKPFADHAYNSTTTACPFNQNNDGIIAAFEGYVRFGLMTFDTATNAGTGYSGASAFVGAAADYPSGIAGTWSYFFNTSATGKPGGCSTAATDFEVGARNPAAPAWEGRMIAFGAPDPSGTNNPTTRAEWIRNILLTTRPYGGTPIDGMLDDARTFLFSDSRKDPVFGVSANSATDDFGPYRDPYVLGGCRKNVIVLLTDGEPNLDLRPECTGTINGIAGKCPYPQQPYEIANDLYVNKGVQTFVVGFAVSTVTLANGTSIDCRTITNDNYSTICANPDPNLQACCTLNRIALSGSGNAEHAYFADSPGELRAALSNIFSKVSTGTTSRTWPVMASANANTASSTGAAGYRFYTSFVPKVNLGKYGSLWNGVIERQRWTCVPPTSGGSPVATLQNASKTAGDSFADNVNSDPTSRQFYTAIGDVVAGNVNSVSFIRPNLLSANDDGAGVYSAAQYGFPPSSFATNVPNSATAMQITNSTCASDTPPLSTAAACAARRLGWLVGLTDTATGYSRCVTAGSTDCSLIADVLHSTPVVVNRPTDAPRDQTYQLFAAAWQERPLVLYTSTNDGMLHAFKVASNYLPPHVDSIPVTSLGNNELWAFIPPAVLPKIDSEWPGSHQELLDGAPVVANVVATPLDTTNNPKYALERTAENFASATKAGGNLTATTWRTVLVQGLNKSQGGYFALDVTNPEPASLNVPYKDLSPGPRFLWQLTDLPSATQRVFGTRSGTPIITTLFFTPPGLATPHEIAVAILPGGYADPDDAVTSVARVVPTPTAVDSRYLARSTIPKYTSASAVAARSLTIVRLDTGEIVRTFRQSKTELPVALQNRVTVAPLDSPITGQPVAYPALTGAIADRVFVGDRDGALWRVNLSSSSPTDWTMSMFFDAYSGQSALAGQPIITQPQLSIDDSGRVTVAFATGSQDTFSAANTNYVWSLTEDINWSSNPVSYKSLAQWYRKYTNGEVAVGPLQLFSSGLYFATYTPAQSTTACGTGTSRVWGMNYLTVDSTATASNGSDALSKGGTAWLPSQGDATSTTKVQYLAADITCAGTTRTNNTDCALMGASVFGVSVAQVPSCIDTSASTTDAFFPTGTHTTMPGATQAAYQLVMQTGNSGTPTNGLKTNVATISLQPQTNGPRIAAWATIME